MILTSGIIGLCAGIILLFLSHLAPRWGFDMEVKDVDQARFGSRLFSRRESHLFGVIIHLLLDFCFGILFGALVYYGMLAMDLASMAIYVMLITLFMGGVIIPLEGHGLFGWHEDHWFIADLLVTNTVWMFLFGMIASVLL